MPGGYDRWEHFWIRGWFLLPLFSAGFLLFIGSRRAKFGHDSSLWFEKTLFATTAAAYPIALHTCWPLITRQDWLPAIPLLILLGVAFLLGHWPVAIGAPSIHQFVLPPPAMALIAGVEILLLLCQQTLWRDALAEERSLVATALRITRPGEFVMDPKGETIFRPRAFYYALEGITTRRMQRGLIRNNIVERLIATDAVLVYPARLSQADLVFVKNNYLSIGSCCVLGKKLLPPSGNAVSGQPYVFEITVPARYQVVDTAGPVEGDLDGEPGAGPRLLFTGSHSFLPRQPPASRPLAVFLASAFEAGYSPFARTQAAQIPSQVVPH